jgi:hypothetical protein
MSPLLAMHRSQSFFHCWNASWNELSVMARSFLIAFSWISSLSLIRRTACARAQFSGCSSMANSHSETGQMAVCCQNLTLDALSSRSALSVLVGAVFRKVRSLFEHPSYATNGRKPVTIEQDMGVFKTKRKVRTKSSLWPKIMCQKYIIRRSRGGNKDHEASGWNVHAECVCFGPVMQKQNENLQPCCTQFPSTFFATLRSSVDMTSNYKLTPWWQNTDITKQQKHTHDPELVTCFFRTYNPSSWDPAISYQPISFANFQDEVFLDIFRQYLQIYFSIFISCSYASNALIITVC